MKKWFKVTALLLCVCLIGARLIKKEAVEVSLYFTDSSMLRLMETKSVVYARNTQEAAEEIVKALERGQEKNPHILRLLPEDVKPIRVKVDGQVAYVDLSRELVEKHSDARVHEILTVYGIVNSLTSLEGIVNVRFTVDGEKERDFKGYLDMRDTFIPDYYI